MFGPKRDENREGWRRLYIEELHNFSSSPNILRANKSRRSRWAGHVARMEEGRRAFKILTAKRELYEYLGVDGNKILGWIIKEYEELG